MSKGVRAGSAVAHASLMESSLYSGEGVLVTIVGIALAISVAAASLDFSLQYTLA